MAMNIQDIINSPIGVGTAMGLARLMPPAAGYRFANFLADRIASRNHLSMVQAVRVNQWVANGETSSVEDLTELVRQTFRHTAHCQYDVYHNLYNPMALERKVSLDQKSQQLVEWVSRGEAGLIVVGPHLSNFDFASRAIGLQGAKALALGLPNPRGGYQWQNKMREEAGMQVLTPSLKSFKIATKHLREGGTVVTGIDRPVPETKYRPKFFGRPAPLPVHHVMLALKTDVPIAVSAVVMRSDGKYEVCSSEPIYMERHGDHMTDLIQNAEKILCLAAEYIQLAPHQWAMFFPLWPELMAKVP